jgi:hypothetical protein
MHVYLMHPLCAHTPTTWHSTTTARDGAARYACLQESLPAATSLPEIQSIWSAQMTTGTASSPVSSHSHDSMGSVDWHGPEPLSNSNTSSPYLGMPLQHQHLPGRLPAPAGSGASMQRPFRGKDDYYNGRQHSEGSTWAVPPVTAGTTVGADSAVNPGPRCPGPVSSTVADSAPNSGPRCPGPWGKSLWNSGHSSSGVRRSWQTPVGAGCTTYSC